MFYEWDLKNTYVVFLGKQSIYFIDEDLSILRSDLNGFSVFIVKIIVLSSFIHCMKIGIIHL